MFLFAWDPLFPSMVLTNICNLELLPQVISTHQVVLVEHFDAQVESMLEHGIQAVPRACLGAKQDS